MVSAGNLSILYFKQYRSAFVTAAALPLILAFPLIAWAGPDPIIPNNGGLKFTPVSDLRQSHAGATVVGGIKANSDLWQASLYPTSKQDTCSATLVGPRALLLAAHCVGDGQEVAFTKFGTDHKGVCTHSENYRKVRTDDSADYALCYITPAVSAIKFETVLRDGSLVKIGGNIVVTGYGCTQYPKQGGNDGIFRLRASAISATPNQSASERNTIKVHDIHMGICPGDSGSGDFIYVADTKRTIAAINSRVDSAHYNSYLSALTTPDAKAFFESWLKKGESAANGEKIADADKKICGVNYFSNDDCQ